MFATAACGAILVVFGAVVTLVVPATLHPVVLPLVPVAVSLLLAQALASYHKRG
jgi:energy-converting hydrogenase Eha subunit E